MRQAYRTEPQPRSWLQRLLAALAAWLLVPRRRRQARRQAALRQHLEALLRPLADPGAGDSGLAVLEGAMALAMADADFHHDEWELYTAGLALLNLQDQQRSGLSLHGSVDLPWVCSHLAALPDPAQRLAVAQFYALLSEADGISAPAEQRVLDQLLGALGLNAQALPRSRPPQGPLERLRGQLAAPLLRWAAAKGERRGG